MRIAIVAETYAPDINGVARSVGHIADALVRKGHEPVVIAPAPAAPAAERPHYRVERVPSRPWPRNPAIRLGLPSPMVADALRRARPDAVYLSSPYLMGGRAVGAARDMGLPTVSLYFTDPAMIVGRGASAIALDRAWAQLRSVHGASDRNLAPTATAARDLEAHGVAPVTVWDQGVDTAAHDPRHRSPRLRRALADADELLVGYVGRLAEEKEIDLLERAAELPGVRLVLVGDGPDRARLRALLPRARFLGARRGRPLARLFATLDVFVHTGSFETFGLTVREAQASGVAVVVPDCGGAADLVDHGATGLTFTAGDPGALAARIAALRDDRAATARLGAAARAATAATTWDAATDELLGHLREASERKEPKR